MGYQMKAIEKFEVSGENGKIRPNGKYPLLGMAYQRNLMVPLTDSQRRPIKLWQYLHCLLNSLYPSPKLSWGLTFRPIDANCS